MSKRKISKRDDTEVRKKIKENADTLKESEEQLADVITNISTVEARTKVELDAIIEAFNIKHGLKTLYDERETLHKRIETCKGTKKYGGCKHPKSAQVRASKGWSGSWRCAICDFEDIDWYGPGN